MTFKFAIATDDNQCRLRFRTGGSTNTVSKYMSYNRYGDNADGLGRLHNSYDDYAYIGSSLEATDTKAITGFMYVFSPLLFNQARLNSIPAGEVLIFSSAIQGWIACSGVIELPETTCIDDPVVISHFAPKYSL